MSKDAAVTVWRIATRGKSMPPSEIPAWNETDLDGVSAAIGGGRWNPHGVKVVYTASSVALACLETVVHLSAVGFPITRYYVEVSIPGDVWKRRYRPLQSELPIGWDSLPSNGSAALFGEAWVSSGSSALLEVPSVVIPMESNFIINPAHSDAMRITATSKGVFAYDQRISDPAKR